MSVRNFLIFNHERRIDIIGKKEEIISHLKILVSENEIETTYCIRGDSNDLSKLKKIAENKGYRFLDTVRFYLPFGKKLEDEIEFITENFKNKYGSALYPLCLLYGSKNEHNEVSIHGHCINIKIIDL